MKLTELIDLMKRVVLSYPNINSFYYGDIYESLNQSRDIEYGTVVVTHQNTSVVDGYLRNHTFNIFAVDRMLDDESNKLQIQSQGQEAIENLLNTLDSTGLLVLNDRQYVNFTQKFADLCAGCYSTVTIQVPIEDCVGEDYAIVNSVGGRNGDVPLKTINGQSIIGVGNIVISGGSGSTLDFYSEDGTYTDGSAKIEVRNANVNVESVDGGTITEKASHIDLTTLNGEARLVLNDVVGASVYTTGDNKLYYNGNEVATVDQIIGGGITSGVCQDMIDASISGKANITYVDAETQAIWNWVDPMNAELQSLQLNKLDASAYTPVDLSNYVDYDALYNELDNYYGKDDVNELLGDKADISALTEVNSALTAHTSDNTIHTNSDEKDFWNAGIISHQSQLNDLKTNKQDVSGMTAYALSSSLATVATSGQYSDLTGTPTFTLSGSTLIITTN